MKNSYSTLILYLRHKDSTRLPYKGHLLPGGEGYLALSPSPAVLLDGVFDIWEQKVVSGKLCLHVWALSPGRIKFSNQPATKCFEIILIPTLFSGIKIHF